MTVEPHHANGTEPYPWPWCGLDVDRTALVVVSSPVIAGEDTTGLDGLLDQITVASTRFHAHAIPTVLARVGSPFTARPALVGAQPELAVETGHEVSSIGWDGFFNTSLDSYLRSRGLDHLILAGWWAEIGVHSTMRSANDRGYECLLATDLVAGLAPDTTRGAISSIHMSGGIFGATGTFTAVLDAINEGN